MSNGCGVAGCRDPEHQSTTPATGKVVVSGPFDENGGQYAVTLPVVDIERALAEHYARIQPATCPECGAKDGAHQTVELPQERCGEFSIPSSAAVMCSRGIPQPSSVVDALRVELRCRIHKIDGVTNEYQAEEMATARTETTRLTKALRAACLSRDSYAQSVSLAVRENVDMLRNLTSTQARCTELLEENRVKSAEVTKLTALVARLEEKNRDQEDVIAVCEEDYQRAVSCKGLPGDEGYRATVGTHEDIP